MVEEAGVPIKNFRKVNAWLFRGGQPDSEGFVALAKMGVKTVVSVRWRRGPAAKEQECVQNLGMKFVHISMNYWTLPPENKVDEFMSIVDDEHKRPVFIHCLHGSDRTGILIAVFRILRCGWTLQKAYEEMVACGFHRFKTRHFKWALWRMADHYGIKSTRSATT